MYEEAAENLDKAIKDKLGEDYTTEDLLRFQMDEGLITPKLTGDYLLKIEFINLLDGHDGSRRSIIQDMAARHNMSPSTIYNLVRDI